MKIVYKVNIIVEGFTENELDEKCENISEILEKNGNKILESIMDYTMNEEIYDFLEEDTK